MQKDKETILIELNKSIRELNKAVETLQTLKINKTKSGLYHKNINKAGFEIKDKEYCDLSFNTYDNKYCLTYYSYYRIVFKDYAELEINKEKELTRLKSNLNNYEEQKDFAINHYNELVKKIQSFYNDLSEEEDHLLQCASIDLYCGLRYFH